MNPIYLSRGGSNCDARVRGLEVPRHSSLAEREVIGGARFALPANEERPEIGTRCKSCANSLSRYPEGGLQLCKEANPRLAFSLGFLGREEDDSERG